MRRVTGYQDFVDEAPLDLVYVADALGLSYDQQKLLSQTVGYPKAVAP